MSEEITTPFETSSQEDEVGNEYWSARDLAKVLEYNDYRNFLKVVDKARLACANSGQVVADHFGDVNDMVQIGSGAARKVKNVHLSRYVCYLVIQNADPMLIDVVRFYPVPWL